MDENSVKCRICLDNNEQDEKMFELFNCNKTTEQTSSWKNNTTELYEKVEYCCRVRIRKSEELPTKICTKCHDMIHFWMQFRKMCLNTQVYLESICKESQLQSAVDIDDEIEKDYWEKLYKHLDISGFDNIEKLIKFEQSDSDNNSFSNDVNKDSTTIIDDIVERIDESDNNSEEPAKITVKNVQRRKKYTKTMQKRNSTRTRTRTRTPSPTSYMCNICGNVYTKKASFTYHMSKHENLKPHECEICSKKFRQVCELKNHIRRHTGEKPYKCKYCDRHFIDRSEKHRHERVHTNTRPYVCSKCGKSFMYSAILKNHSKLHSGEKSFNCLVCEKSFTLQHHLKAHLRTIVHKQKELQYISAGYDVVYE